MMNSHEGEAGRSSYEACLVGHSRHCVNYGGVPAGEHHDAVEMFADRGRGRSGMEAVMGATGGGQRAAGGVANHTN
jgi:hypothetical protein